MHAANRAAWDEAAERYEGWLDEAVDADPRRAARTCSASRPSSIGDLHGRCRRAIHLQCAGGRDTLSLWNLGADEVVGVDFSPRMLDLAAPPDRGDRRAGPLDPVRRPRDARTSSTARPTSSTRAAARSSGSRTSTPGRPSSPASSPRPGGSCCSRAIRPSGCSTSTRTAAGSRPTTTTSAGRGVEGLGARVHRPAVDRRCRPELEVRPGLDARRGRSPRCSAPACGSSAVAEHPIDWWGGHADVRAEERGRIPLSFSVTGRKGPG